MKAPDKPILIGLAGQPNVGKSTVFNLLTGLRQHVGNWPGKTVERREGTLLRDGVALRVVDLPGTYSLTANSPKERIARDFILHERPDVVIMIADAAALERNLYLLAELLLLPVPVVLGLNMMDVARAQGIEIEPHVLAAALGIPVVPLVARRARGVAELASEALRLARRPAEFKPARPEIAAPLGEVLGLDWRLLVALLASFVAKEDAIAALGILYGSSAGAGLAETLAATVPPASALSFLAATMLFIPCAATLAVMRKETGSWRWTLFGVGLLLAIALGAAALVYQGCRVLGFGMG